MNERIRELMLLAGTDTSGKWMGVEHAERFAELIVQECVTVAMKAVSDDEPKEAWYLIKEHFGVK
jgi:hypothetical protein